MTEPPVNEPPASTPSANDPAANGPVTPVASARSRLQQLAATQLRQTLASTAKSAGQQAGVLAQAVRQSGEDLRREGQPGRGKVADQVAAPLQRLSGTLSHVDPAALTLDPRAGRSQVAQQAQQLRVRGAEQLDAQVGLRTSQLGQVLGAVVDGMHRTSDDLRAQGQEVTALVVDALAEQAHPLQGYLESADGARVRSGATGLGRSARAGLTTATAAVDRTQHQAESRAAGVAKRTLDGVRHSPALPLAGAVLGVVLAARHASGHPSPATTEPDAVSAAEPEPAPVQAVPDPAPAAEEDMSSWSKAQLRERALAAGIKTSSKMSKKELRDLIRRS